MNLKQIALEARKEQDLPRLWEQVTSLGTQFPNGVEITIKPSSLIPFLEEYCDSKRWPFFHVVGDICSTALTYSQLYEFEKQR